MAEIIAVRFKREGKQYYFDPRGLTVAVGDCVILETSWGVEFGECVRGNSEVPNESLVAPLRPILRLATAADHEIVRRNRAREKDAFAVCRRKIEEHGLDMKLVDVEFGFEGNKILFFFTSEGRVDFRALVKDLASIFHSRIELRQIGVRDEAKMLGGLGICGRAFCCASFLRDFQPVSIKMAKTQNLSLNPSKISGTCGRLMCCLKYEQEAYEDLLRHSPRPDSFVETPDGVGDIVSVSTLREKVRVRLDNAPDTIKIYHSSELRVIRSGKGKRPEDYRPPSPQELEKLRRVQREILEEAARPESALHSAALPLASESEMRPPSRARTGARPQTHKPPFVPKDTPSSARKDSEAPFVPVGDNKKPRHSPKTPSQAAIEKALPREKQPQAKESADNKKLRRPYWRKKPGSGKPRKKDGD